MYKRQVYVQTTLAQKEQDEWPAEPYKVIEDLSPQDGVKVEFDEGEHVIGVKVEYTNVLAGFYSEGLVIHTTFLNRSWSSRDINELRQISNQASIAWKDSQLDENGDPLETGAHMGSQNSQIVFAQILSLIHIYQPGKDGISGRSEGVREFGCLRQHDADGRKRNSSDDNPEGRRYLLAERDQGS